LHLLHPAVCTDCHLAPGIRTPPAYTLNFHISFLYSLGIRGALHSFPTRRSSDLGGKAETLRDLALYVLRDRMNDQNVAYAMEERSEEHTSELQSRENLVCRLLLEKKKTDIASYGVRYRTAAKVICGDTVNWTTHL